MKFHFVIELKNWTRATRVSQIGKVGAGRTGSIDQKYVSTKLICSGLQCGNAGRSLNSLIGSLDNDMRVSINDNDPANDHAVLGDRRCEICKCFCWQVTFVC